MKMKHEQVMGQRLKTFTFMRKLGEGAWAIVYEAFDERTNTTVAIKAIPQVLMKETPKLRELVQTEIRVLKECHNENVVRFVDSFVTERTQFIAMEYCNSGDLEGYLDKKKRLTEDEATTFLKQILNGFRGLHEVNAMHRDFKVANVLLHDGMCKIADLGFAKQLEKKKMTGTILGTSLTMAPELLRDQKYGMEADIWSVGVVYYQLLYGKYPFSGMSDM
jgi:serine/threonine protein kinase